MDLEILMWVGFCVFVFTALFVDLFMHGRNKHIIGIKESLIWSAFWIGLALAFNVLIYFTHGLNTALDFLAAYLIEESLSIDNLFVFLLIFGYFKTPASYLHKVLFWGILGAVVMRAIFIFFGIALISNFHWLIYVFGVFLVVMGIKMSVKDDEDIHPENNPILILFRKFMPVSKDYHGDSFFFVEAGKLIATPLFIVLLAVETTDLVFAIDSIPAVLAITLDPFIVFTSNIFAILGLRSIFFALAALMGLFHHLNYGISAILVFVGIKMLISPWVHISTPIALGFIISSILISITSSLYFPEKKKEKKLDEILKEK